MENLLLGKLRSLVLGTDYCPPQGADMWNPAWGALTEQQLKYDIMVVHYPSNRFFSNVESNATVSFYCRHDVVKNWGCSLNRKTVLGGFSGNSFFFGGGWSPGWEGYASNTELLTAQNQTCQCNTTGCVRPVCWPPPRALKQITIRIRALLPPNKQIETRTMDSALSTYVIPGQSGTCSHAFNFNGACTQPYIESQIRTVFDTFYDGKGNYVRNNVIVDSLVSEENTSLVNYPVVLVREKKELETSRLRNMITTNNNR